jgi:cytidine deaminase
MQNLTKSEKLVTVKYLYNVAKSDKKILDSELKIIMNLMNNFELTDIDLSNVEWSLEDNNEFNKLVDTNSAYLGFVTKWATDIMNSDNVKHQNEQQMILNMISTSLGNPKYPKAETIPISELTEIQKQMMIITPEKCLNKNSDWQKNKKGKPLKRVGASISFEINGKMKFVSGVNYELSTPGGSRCAEQNAIGAMIAQYPELKKEDVRDIFVYGGGGIPNPCFPCGVCSENISKINVNNQINLFVYPENYVYSEGSLPKNMLRLAFGDFVY